MHKTILNEEYKDDQYFINADGFYLWRHIWSPKDQPVKAIVFISHGYGEHSGVYEEHLARPLNKIGCLVLGHDHMGHGRSEGERIFLPSVKPLVRDVVDDLTDYVSKHWPNNRPPIFLYGHSMGGLVATLAGLESPSLFTGGIILDAALLRLAPEIAPWWKVNGVKFVQWLMPRLKVGKIELQHLSRDPQVAVEVQNDPLMVNLPMNAATAWGMIQGVCELDYRLQHFEPSVLVLHGTEDKLTNFSGVQYFKEKAVQCKDISTEIYPDAFHQLLRELPPVKEKHMETILNWIKARS